MADVWTIGQLTQGYGPTSEQLDGPYQGYAHFNKGIDLGAPKGTPIPSNIRGTVVRIGTDPNDPNGWGIQIWIKDNKGNIHRFNHMDSVNPGLKVGDFVPVGYTVGTVGSTGKSTGPHLSYDVTDAQGNFIDPSDFVSPESTRVRPIENLSQPNQTPTTISQAVASGEKAKNPTPPKTYKAPTQLSYGLSDLDRIGTQAKSLQFDIKQGLGSIFGGGATPQGDKILISKPSPLGALSKIFQGQDFETTYQQLYNAQIELVQQLDGMEGGLESEQIIAQIKIIDNALERLLRARDAGLYTTGIDAAKAHLETEQDQARQSKDMFSDYISRMETLSSIGDYGDAAFASNSKLLNSAKESNAALYRGQERGEISPLIGPQLVRFGKPSIDLMKYAPGLESTIPLTPPVFQPVNASTYSNYVNAINSRRIVPRISTLAGDNYSYMDPSTIPLEQRPFGV